jgi:hypothetical protein
MVKKETQMDVEKADQELDFPINQALLEGATKAMEEWRVIRDRLRRIEEHRDQVSEAVYERVRHDYEQKLAQATDLLLSKKEDIDGELATLYATRQKIEEQLVEHRQDHEEVKFRNTLGEYQESEFQDKSKDSQDKISKFETILSAVDTNIGRYESIFAGEEELFARHEETAPEEEISEVAEISSVSHAPHEIEPLTDESGYVLEEEEHNYFTPSEAEGTPHGREDSQTARASIDPKVAEKLKASGPRPRIVIINGENAGAAFPIKGTTSLGRADSNSIPLKDSKASRQHAQIQKQGNEFILLDLNSSNGTFVNGERIDEHVLSNGDEIMIGDSILQFQLEA